MKFLYFILIGCLLLVEGKYKNLYGDEEFDPEAEDPELLEGLMNLLNDTDQFRRSAQPDITPKNEEVYDFIIVGAGSAGCVVASRLSELKGLSVLLIEAGDEEIMNLDIPMLAPRAQLDRGVTWDYKTIPSDKYCRGMKNKQCRWPRGKVMGGTSILNYMLATRGWSGDFDQWESFGNKGWAYKDILKYFKKLEHINIPELMEDKKYHGTDGPMSINYAKFQTPMAKNFRQAAEQMGISYTDYNGENFNGYSRPQTTTYNGTRMSSNKAYLHNKFRKNLHVTKKSTAKKILIDTNRRRAIGIEFIKNDKTIKVYAKKEVIITSGVIGSPHLLMLSGIGPKKNLQDVGIKVIKDLPVGENLHDHISYLGLAFTIDQPISLAEMNKVSAPYIRDYIKTRDGPLNLPGGVELIAFTDVYNRKGKDWVPTMEYILFPTILVSDPSFLDGLGLTEEAKENLKPLNGKHGWTCLPMILQPKSRGWLKLKSSNYKDAPILHANYYSHPEDLDLMIRGVNVSLQIAQTPAMKKLNSKLFEIDVKECRHLKNNFKQHTECMLRYYTMTVYHQCGTCRMGPEGDKTTVVNPQLQVVGVENLRVVDASIMPTITSAHLNVAVYMIAEKASDMIKQYWGYPTEA